MRTPAAKGSKKKRTRLPADVRAQQLLDAALVEFSNHGFAATRIEDIAHRAGLSKSGVYAHYASKEAIFEALLEHAFRIRDAQLFVVDADATLEALVDRFVDHCYTEMADPVRVGMLRLLITESARVPGLIQRWHAEVLAPFRHAQAGLMAKAVADGRLRKGPLTDQVALLHAPVLYAATTEMVLRNGALADPHWRAAHKQMLLTLLTAS